MAPITKAGVIYVKINGIPYALGENVKLDFGTLERETITGLDGVHGYAEKPKPASVELDMVKVPDLPLHVFDNMRDETIQIACRDGDNYVFRNAWCTKGPEYDAAKGSYTLRFEGPGSIERV